MRTSNSTFRSKSSYPEPGGDLDLSIQDYGWSERFAAAFDELRTDVHEPARVTRAASDLFRVRAEAYRGQATLGGKLRHEAETAADLPAVGDWVAIRRPAAGDARIDTVLPRRSVLSRNVAGKRTGEQVVAANVDLVVVVMGLDGDFNLRRLERYVTAVWESAARPLVLLNKSDLCEDTDRKLAAARSVAPGATALTASCKRCEGVDRVREQFRAGETGVLVGSSGAGKSTLINLLLGDAVQPTRQTREGDDRGRHTTTHREMFLLPGGGLLIDSPGIRELQLWGGEASLAQTFDDVAELAEDCRFRDCGHGSETGCAVLRAVEQGSLTAQRLESYRSLQKELRHLEIKQSQSAQRAEKQKWKGIQKEYRRFTKKRGR